MEYLATIKRRCAACTSRDLTAEGDLWRCDTCGRLSNMHGVDEPELIEES